MFGVSLYQNSLVARLDWNLKDETLIIFHLSFCQAELIDILFVKISLLVKNSLFGVVLYENFRSLPWIENLNISEVFMTFCLSSLIY
jgi:hypothetical protein